MSYDFTTAVNRAQVGSLKWKRMKEKCSELPNGVIPFSVADMDLKNPPEVVDAIKEFLDTYNLGYPAETEEYRRSVVGWMKKRHGWSVGTDTIVTTPGVVNALWHCVRTFTEPGDGVLIFTPVYPPFYRVVRQNQREVIECPLKDLGDHYEIDFEDLRRKAADPRVKLMIFCNPHNPGGVVWEREVLEQVYDACRAFSFPIVSDEIHSDLILPGHSHTVFASLSEEAAARTITCTSPSKTFNLAGLQISNILITNPELRKRFALTVDQCEEDMRGALSYVACQAAYDQCEGWLDELLELVDRNRRILEAFLEDRLPEIRAYRMDGTYMAWLDCRALGLSGKELEAAMEEENLFFNQGYVFGKAGEGFVRIVLACPEENVRQMLPRLENAVRKCRK